MPTARPAPFDLARTMELLGQDAGLLSELVELFRSEVPALRAALSRSVGAADLPRAARDAHSLKGAIGSFAAKPAFDAAAAVEAAAKEGRADEIRRLAAVLEDELTRLESALPPAAGGG